MGDGEIFFLNVLLYYFWYNFISAIRNLQKWFYQLSTSSWEFLHNSNSPISSYKIIWRLLDARNVSGKESGPCILLDKQVDKFSSIIWIPTLKVKCNKEWSGTCHLSPMRERQVALVWFKRSVTVMTLKPRQDSKQIRGVTT